MHVLRAPQGDSDRKNPLSDGIEAPELINGEMSDLMSSYYGKVRGRAEIIRGDF